jgi:chromosome segregation ATPase
MGIKDMTAMRFTFAGKFFMKTTVMLAMAMLMTVFLASGEAKAADAEDQKVQRIQHMLRQVSQVRDALQAENTRLKSEIEELNRKHTGIKKSSDTALAKSRESSAALGAELQRTEQNLRQIQSDKDLLQETVVGQAQQLETCESHNVKLLQVNRDLLGQYENKGFFDSLMQREPIIGLKGVELENILQDYQDRLDRLVFRKTETTTTP